jgi:hypothetical protein
MSRKARINFALDAIIAVAFLLSAVSGIILYLVPGGYQGGRNPYYGREVLGIGHHTWSDWHTWGSFVMIAGVLLHLALHWRWIVCMVKNTLGLGQKRTLLPTKRGAQEACPVTVEVE